MENDDDMRRTMEPLVSCLLIHVGVNTFTSNSFAPLDLQSKEFYQNAKAILIAKRPSILTRWQKFFENSCLKSLSTHEMYIRYVLFACDIEIRFSNNIFDGILSIFALVVNFNIETFINSWMNFCELSIDIFMAFYKSTLKESFYLNGGFQQFAKYLLICTERHHLEKHKLQEQIKEAKKFLHDPNFIKHSDIAENSRFGYLAREILLTTRIKLPQLRNITEVEVRLQSARQQRALLFDIFSKCITSDKASKSEMTTASSKCKTVDLAFIDETLEKEQKQNSTDVEIGSQAAKQRETLLVTTFSKHQASSPASKSKATTSSKRKTVETSNDESLKRELKRNSADIKVNLQDARQREKLLASTLPKWQANDTSLKNYTMTSSKLKSVEMILKKEKLEEDWIQNLIDVEVRLQTPTQGEELLFAQFPKCQASDTALERETTASSKRKTAETVSKDEMVKKEPKHEASSTDLKSEETTSSKRKTVEIVSKDEMVKEPKHEASNTDSNTEATTFSNRKTVETSNDESLERELKRNSADVKVSLQAARQREELLASTLLKCQANDTSLKNDTMTSSKLKTEEIVLKKEIEETDSIQNSTDVEVILPTPTQREELLFAQFPKYQASDTALERETTASSKRKTVEAASNDETLEKEPKRNSTDVEVRLQAPTQREELLFAPFPKCQESDTALKSYITTVPSECKSVEVASKDEMEERESQLKASEIKGKINSTKSSPLVEIISWKQCMILAKNMEKHQKHIKWLETIAETREQYISSKCCDSNHANSRFHKEAETFLKHLKDMINTLVDALESCDEE